MPTLLALLLFCVLNCQYLALLRENTSNGWQIVPICFPFASKTFCIECRVKRHFENEITTKRKQLASGNGGHDFERRGNPSSH